jgi:hypothetical protein
MKTFFVFLVSVITLLFSPGCHNMNMPDHDENIISMHPANGQTNVSVNGKINIKFNKPAEKGIVEEGFKLYNGNIKTEGACISDMMNHDLMMKDHTMMQHLNELHHVKGSFVWNEYGTECYFTPDSDLEGNAMYMIYFDNKMMSMMLGNMGHGGMTMHGNGMGMHGNGMGMHNNNMEMMKNYGVMMHFTTEVKGE